MTWLPSSSPPGSLSTLLGRHSSFHSAATDSFTDPPPPPAIESLNIRMQLLSKSRFSLLDPKLLEPMTVASSDDGSPMISGRWRGSRRRRGDGAERSTSPSPSSLAVIHIPLAWNVQPRRSYRRIFPPDDDMDRAVSFANARKASGIVDLMRSRTPRSFPRDDPALGANP